MKSMSDKEIYRLYEAEESRKNKSINDKDDKDTEEKDEENEKLKEIDDKKEDGKKKVKDDEERKKDIKESLLSECIYNIYTKALGHSGDYLIEGSELKRRSLVNSFIKENNSLKIIRDFKTKNILLSEYNILINSYYNRILESSKIKNEEIIIAPEEKDEFIEDINNVESDKVIKIISDRVLDAVQNFIISNQEDKQNIMNILSDAQEKIDSTIKVNVQEAHSGEAKRRISDIRHNRYTSLLEFIIEKISKESYINESMKSEYLTPENKLNMDRIMESSIEIYTLLETLNTLNIIKIDEEYISKFCKEF